MVTKHLGDIVIAPSYVSRRCFEDKVELEIKPKNCNNSSLVGLGQESYSERDDRGASRIMSTLFEVQERIPLLIIHSILHLIG